MRFFLTIVGSFIGVLAALFFIFLVFAALIATQDTTPSVANRTVLVIDLDRALPETQPTDPFEELIGGRAVTLRQTIRALDKAAADDRISGVWLRPTGVSASWATLAELRDALERFKQSGKPLVASSGDGGFMQGSYYLASAADSVYSPPETVFVMNGFSVTAPFFAEMFERLGIEPIVVRAGDYKSAGESFTERQFSPENREQYTELVVAIDNRFRNTVAQARPATRDEIDRVIAGGGIYQASEAAALGLLDELRYEHEVEALWRHHTRQDADAELRTISLRDYVRVPEREAGLRQGDRRNRIAVLYATGTIMPGRGGADGLGGTILGSGPFVDALQDAARDDATRAIVIRIDSPGGSAMASDAMWAAVRDAARERPVVVSMASVAASGGYYIAAPADVIVAEPATITGSIGVISTLFDATEFLDDRIGITLDTIQTGPGAGLFAMPVTPLEIEIIEQMTERFYETFVQRVAEGRNLDPVTVRQIGGGRVYTGQRAMELGLVDEVGGLERAIAIAAERAELEEGDYRLTILPRRRPLFERLSEVLSADAAMRWWVQRNMTPEERLIRKQTAVLRQAVQMHGHVQMRLLEVPEIR